MAKIGTALILIIVVVAILLLYASGLLLGNGSKQSPASSVTVGPSGQGNSSATTTLPPDPYMSYDQAAGLMGAAGNYSLKECISTENCSNMTFSGTLWTVEYRVIGNGPPRQLYETLFNSTSAQSMYSSAAAGLSNVTASKASSTYEGLQYTYYYAQSLPPPYGQFFHMVAIKDTYFASITVVTGYNASAINPPALIAALAGELP